MLGIHFLITTDIFVRLMTREWVERGVIKLAHIAPISHPLLSLLLLCVLISVHFIYVST